MKVRLFTLLLLLTGFKPTSAQQTFYDLNTIQKIEIFFTRPDWEKQLDSLKATTDGYLKADSVRINGSNFKNVGVKYKGNSSYDSSFKKNPFTIGLDKFQEQSYQDINSIKLSNGYQDPSMIREVLSYNILKNYMHCSRSNFAEVYINGASYGIYSNIEDISKSFCADHFKSTKTNTFIKCNPIVTPGPTIKSNLKYISSDSNAYANLYEIKSTFGWNELVSLCNTVTNNAAKIETVMDMDRFLWMLAFNSLLANLDSYTGAFSQNYFVFKDNTGVYNPIVWDLNMSFGGFPFAGSSNTSLGSLSVANLKQMPISLHATDPYWPMINIVMGNATYKRMFVAHIRTMMNEMFASNQYQTMATQMQNTIDAAVKNDPAKFFSYSDFQSGMTVDKSVGSYTVPGISNLMTARVTYLQSQSEFTAKPPVLSNQIFAITKSWDTATMLIQVTNGKSVYLGYRDHIEKKFTRIPMYDDGKHGDFMAGDSFYAATIPLNLENSQYYFYAENDQAGIFLPERSEHEYYSFDPTLSVDKPPVRLAGLNIFPNPFNEVLKISGSGLELQDIEIFTPDGKTMFKGTFQKNLEINSELWQAGLYFLRMDGRVFKIMKSTGR